jgi:serine-type D-Ala-D-Ala carboxypeptidase (penicillin-binding protein 5/6)
MASKFDLTKREIASLTKIMTLWVCLQLIEKFSIDPEKEIVTVSDQASCQGGTTANLFEGDKLTVWDCFHALMLPSGNDAAVALSEHFGNILLKNSTFSKKNFINLNNSNSENTPYKVFLDEMNKYAKELNMVYTFYANPHGL